MSETMARLDVVIFGASGYSGKRVVVKLQEAISTENRIITWGIAGRSRNKLEDVLEELNRKTGRNFDHVPIVIADTQNESSLLQMASKAHLIINCTGPYKFHGEPVVRACIEEKCHYIDIAAEPQFMENVQLMYDEETAQKGIYVVTACGANSIPADIGLSFLQKNFKGTLNSAEVYLEMLTNNGYGLRPTVHYATLKTLINVLADYNKLKEIRRKLFKNELPTLKPKLSVRRCLHKIPLSENYAGPYPGSEATVMRRSQRYFYENNISRPVQVHTYLGVQNTLYYCLALLIFFLVMFASKFQFLVNLLLKYPRFFTFGIFGNQPREEDTRTFEMNVTLYGRGWKGKIVDEKYEECEDSWILAKVKERDVYDTTGTCAAVSALVLLDELKKFSKKGGVYTTASFFRETSLTEMLQRNGLQFEICGQGKLC